MTVDAEAFIAGLPKAELHLHIEGTLERSLCAELAVRNGIAVGSLLYWALSARGVRREAAQTARA